MDFEKKLAEILGAENADKVEAITKIVPEFFSGKTNYNDMSRRAKEAEAKLADLETELEDLRSSKLPQEEELKKQMAKAQKRELEYTKKLNRLEAQDIFRKAGFEDDEFDAYIDNFVSEDLEKTKANVTTFVDKMKVKIDIIKQKAEEDKVDNLDRPGGSGADSESNGMTQEKFNTLSYTEQIKYQNSNPEQYKVFTSNS